MGKASSAKKSAEEHISAFCEGRHCRAYEFFGAHPEKRQGKDGYLFRVWAPRARNVAVTGGFNGWDGKKNPMGTVGPGVWELFIPGLSQYENYKYEITGKDGASFLKADPFAFFAELRPATASKLYDLAGYRWQDENYIAWREKNPPYDRPVNIYEAHPGSWRRHEDGSFYSYAETAKWIIPYAKEMGYTHIELLPVTEFPFDGSWGYQCAGYFAATARYGAPKDFMAFVDACHEAGLGVLIDWVPAHFPKDAHGLSSFDGGFLYEYEDPKKREHKDWGTLIFDYARPEVASFLLSSAMFWFDMFHIDGMRVDAVASMLYLDYSRGYGEWTPNAHGGRENLEAVEFLRRLNASVFAEHPGVLMVAEESTAWPMVTKPVEAGGLGFNFKWNMGWMNDTLAFMKTGFSRRHEVHGKLTFSMTYAFSENYILPLSHDETVHEKKSFLDKMPGEYDEKFAGLRALYGYMMAHPGKKLLFMGGEFGQFREWNHDGQLDWMLLSYPRHAELREYVRQLNLFYLRTPAFWQIENDWAGFQWISHLDGESGVVVFRRMDREGRDVLAAFNFSPVPRENYRVGLPSPGGYQRIFSSGEARFGGAGAGSARIAAEEVPLGDFRWSGTLSLPPLSAAYFAKEPPDEEPVLQKNEIAAEVL